MHYLCKNRNTVQKQRKQREVLCYAQISLNDLLLLTLERKFEGTANPFSVETLIPEYQASILDIPCKN